MDRALELARREEVFAWLEAKLGGSRDTLSWPELIEGVPFRGRIQPLFHRQRGIYCPAGSEVALSIRTSLRDPYGDEFSAGASLSYVMAGDGPDSRDNHSVRRAMELALPLVYLHQVSNGPPAEFVVVHPVWVVGEDRVAARFRIEALPSASQLAWSDFSAATVVKEHDGFSQRIQREYAMRRVKARLHQAAFRERVLHAYRRRCAVCRLGHERLLDAAHITPDSEALGEPIVSNGLCLCRLHHGAFDLGYWAAEPGTLAIRVRREILEESDGPMLLHGLQALHGTTLVAPPRTADRPDRERLEMRWRKFLATG